MSLKSASERNIQYMKHKLLSLLILFLSATTLANAQSVVVEAKMDSSIMLMGHQTEIHLSLIQDAGKDVVMPSIKERAELIEGVEALRISRPDTTLLSNDRWQINQDLLVTSFDSGFYYIPPFEYILDSDTFKTESLSLKIVPVDVDSLVAENIILDINDIIDVPFILWDMLPLWAWITIPIVLIIILVIVLLVWRIMKLRKRRNGELIPDIPKVPPYELAMSQLQQLREEKLWQQGQDRIYYTRLTDILREYLVGRFGVNAMEMTTSEILACLKKHREWRDANKIVKEVLELADFVKFAKMSPQPEDNERVMRRVTEYVELTRPQPEPQEDPKAPDNNTPDNNTPDNTPANQ